ncbi:NAD(P)/FAD-dependent oxidoreductase [Virgibacillus sp. NKC19-16]|uniref:NAD(P)/FAD-dependent oxidoreductase n=1 Tax=Virgibacillus salidurans TaxID=2831673 RepID=UPI001F400534|nr:NAD(P)/FAD-dependent oxidoreductase [Virgibacillus sp. NKC19-16]UJL47759.1 NAD(P)/FAD-dependent oxidoreductase [Virgibacillus sp. NKC19-16]
MNTSKPKIVVLGAGYAGLTTTRRLTQKLHPEEAEIVLVNKHNYHYESTWLHEVAAGTINPNQARVMLSDIVNPNRVRLIYDSVVEVKKDEQRVVLENSEITYDYLVFALGFESNDFGIKGMDEHAFAIEDIDSSRLISEHMEYQFAKYKTDENADDDSLNILIGGAGFTGVELLGELTEKVPELCKKFDIDRSKARIISVEAAPSILPMFDKDLVDYAKKSLEDRGVEFRIGAPISECTPDGFIVGDDKELIKAGTVVWTGGVKGSSVLENSGFELTKGKVNVDADLRLPGEENFFVLGDCSWVWDKEADRPYGPTAQLATQEADVAANNLKALLDNRPLEEFVFKSKGTVASLGVTDGIGTVLDDYKLRGKSAAAMKKVVDNRSLFLVGGPKLVLKKGKIRPF